MQARTATHSLTSTRQSKQVPIPQKMPLWACATRVVRQEEIPFNKSPPAIVSPSGASRVLPSKRNRTVASPLFMVGQFFSLKAARRIGCKVHDGLATEDEILDGFSSDLREADSRPLVPGGMEQTGRTGVRSNDR